MSATTCISAQIPVELSKKLDEIALVDERSKSYYVKKGLEMLLIRRMEDIEDYNDGNRVYDEFLASWEKAIPFSEIKKELNL